MLKEFRDFALRGNVVDMAVGIIIGAAFGRIITSFVNDVLMPPIGLLTGKVDFGGLFINLSGQPFATLKDAKTAGAPVIAYGLFVSSVIDFIIVAFVIFLVIRQANRLAQSPQAAPAAPTTKECPHCASSIPAKARRCPHCTSEVVAAQPT